MKQDLVSIIIPIYNVEDYLEECISSVIGQTYTNIEILLIDDGSTDSSLEICNKWKEKDERIQVFTKNNEGLGPTRNFGVKHANGAWIAFLDSDDWIESTYIEKLYKAAIDNHVPLAKCSWRQVDMVSGSTKRKNNFQSIGIEYPWEKVIVKEAGTIWDLLAKKDLFVRFYLEQPNCKAQDFAVGLAVCLAAGKCAFVDEVLLNYRKGRPGALTTGKQSRRVETAEIALPWLINILKRNNLYESNIELIKRHTIYALTYMLFGGWMNVDARQYAELKAVYTESLINKVNYSHMEIAHIGSWNLVETMRVFPYLQDMNYAFHFSSLISMMSNKKIETQILHKNDYRRKMIERDIHSVIWDVFDKQIPQWVVFDLLEERNNILLIDGVYITESDALRECGMEFEDTVIIESSTEEWFELWKKSCDQFMVKLQDYLDLRHVIMIRNYLTESYGNIHEQTEYDESAFIRKSNETIKKCYDYIQEHFVEIHVIDVSREQYYITDIHYEYGVYPWHTNAVINEKIAEEIGTVIKTTSD